MRVALCVGCDEYRLLQELRTATTDGSKLYECLVDPEKGRYDRGSSIFLSNPDLRLVRQTLTDVLRPGNRLDTFTFFFAGHAATRDNSLYLCLADSDPKFLSATALPFIEFMRIVSETRPDQVNIIVDACHSGALGSDVIKALHDLSASTTILPGISALASSMADQQSRENSTGGLLTSEMMKYLSGEKVLQTSKQFLDLAEIGCSINLLLRSASVQTPSVWMVNIAGPNRFCMNPHYSGISRPIEYLVKESSNPLGLTTKQAWNLRRAIEDVRDGFDELSFCRAIREGVRPDNVQSSCALLAGLAESAVAQALDSDDPFLALRAMEVIAGQSVRLSSSEECSIELKSVVVEKMRSQCWRGLRDIKEGLDSDKLLLVRSEDPISSLFVLPIRIISILGRVGATLLCSSNDAGQLALLGDLTRKLLADYGNSIVCVSDQQAPALAVCIAGFSCVGWTHECEEIIGRLYNDLTDNIGRVAPTEVDGESAYTYLKHKYDCIAELPYGCVQTPSDLASAVLLFASLLRLDEAIDYSLVQLDHLHLNYFLSDERSDLEPRAVN
jgi:hypothetical protein